MLGSPLQTGLLLVMALLLVAALVLVCVGAVNMVIGSVQRARAASELHALPPRDPNRQRRVKRLMLAGAALAAASFLLSALGRFI